MFLPLVLLAAAADVTVLQEGVELVVRLEQSVSSEKVRAGDPVPLTVVHAVKVGDCTVVAQDAAVEGRVIVAQHKTYFGRNGLLDIAAARVQSSDGSWVRLRHAPVKADGPATTKVSTARSAAGLAGAIGYGPNGLIVYPGVPIIRVLAKGKETWIPRSMRFKVYTDEHRAVSAQCQSP